LFSSLESLPFQPFFAKAPFKQHSSGIFPEHAPKQKQHNFNGCYSSLHKTNKSIKISVTFLFFCRCLMIQIGSAFKFLINNAIICARRDGSLILYLESRPMMVSSKVAKIKTVPPLFWLCVQGWPTRSDGFCSTFSS
jgi:hypothetical protein